MSTTTKPLPSLTAADLMSRDVITIPRAMSLRAAGHLLSEAQISGAPVVDEMGECIGVLSAIDFMHWIGYGKTGPAKAASAIPSGFPSAWQILEAESVPTDEVGNYMTANPVTVSPTVSIAELARGMTDAHIHRLIVVDDERRPIGVISSTDVLAAVALADCRHAKSPRR
jgi:CBS domain-containing protein